MATWLYLPVELGVSHKEHSNHKTMARACIWRKKSLKFGTINSTPDILGGFVVYFASVVSFTDIFTSLIYYIISKKWEYNAALICTTHVNATFLCLPKMNFRVPLSINCELYSVCTPITLPPTIFRASDFFLHRPAFSIVFNFTFLFFSSWRFFRYQRLCVFILGLVCRRYS